ncbi:anaerobic ribonucleoside-triphosphate reductase activating protein [Salinicoccus bachuensis]|uniref:Anaerobic ribonucleoside-triphosphate reductase-activating protein n=1 Tax=Salinicoccus bachuensis TaxID=3136731 RepID=A0ABZ3CJ02_9STAP
MQALQIYDGQYHIAKIEPHSFVDGEGVRCSIYLSGCPFSCPGCYNLHAQKFTYGERCSDAVIEEIISYCEADYIEGLSILGGEPFCNMALATEIISRFRARFGKAKSIWVWTGFMFEYLANDQRRYGMLKEIDVLVDGPFVDWLYRPGIPFRGSLNQRVIDVQYSLRIGTVMDYM